ncbi:MAG: MotA/TolQ/ExbB proton channel family protein [Treponema sp.]|jgi:biopolymer transport protein ExbB|nr:MotA/TolQ/ExbB proton channel family protein [Treponema sp.]
MKNSAAFLAFMNSGGPVNWIIAGLYVLVLVIFSERVIYFFHTRYQRDLVYKNLRDHCRLDGDGFSWPPRYGRTQPVQMALCFIKNAHEPAPVLAEILDREAALIKTALEQGQGGLSFVGHVAPLFGLLGTITGLMNAFRQIAARGAGVDMAFLSGGIWEAMITTATGLVTAICAVSCGKWFEHISAARLQDMAFTVSILTEQYQKAGLIPPASGNREAQKEGLP